MNWKEAGKHLYEVKSAYEEIGWTGSFALKLVIDPLILRFLKGERTEALYNEIMETE